MYKWLYNDFNSLLTTDPRHLSTGTSTQTSINNSIMVIIIFQTKQKAKKDKLLLNVYCSLIKIRIFLKDSTIQLRKL